jgi:hypothetical protein
MKPTVSATRAYLPGARYTLRRVGSKVAKGWSATKALDDSFERESRFNSDDLPTLVYPTSATSGGAPAADEVRLPVAQLREFDLQLPLAAACALREDVEDDHRAIDDRKGDDPLQARSLARPQVVEHEDLRRPEVLRERRDLARFAAADHGGRIDRRKPLHDAADDRGAGGLDQRLELRQLRRERPRAVTDVDGDDKRPFRGRGGRASSRHAGAGAR